MRRNFQKMTRKKIDFTLLGGFWFRLLGYFRILTVESNHVLCTSFRNCTVVSNFMMLKLRNETGLPLLGAN